MWEKVNLYHAQKNSRQTEDLTCEEQNSKDLRRWYSRIDLWCWPTEGFLKQDKRALTVNVHTFDFIKTKIETSVYSKHRKEIKSENKGHNR